MGYRSQVAFKTTTEGYVLFKKFNDGIKVEEEKPLRGAQIQQSENGFYRISFEDVKWYDSYLDVQNFYEAMEHLESFDIPYSFIRIGEDSMDIEHKINWTDDMPYEIETFEPVVDVNDEEWNSYTDVEDDKDHIKEIMFKLFDEFEECDDAKYALRDMNSDGVVTNEEYDYAIEHWDELLKEWEERKEV